MRAEKCQPTKETLHGVLFLSDFLVVAAWRQKNVNPLKKPSWSALTSIYALTLRTNNYSLFFCTLFFLRPVFHNLFHDLIPLLFHSNFQSWQMRIAQPSNFGPLCIFLRFNLKVHYNISRESRQYLPRLQ